MSEGPTAVMTRVFFTYVWGEPTPPAWPLTFATKAARRFARDNVGDGDYVFTVATKDEPTRIDLRGFVTGLYRLTDLELNTADYDIPRDDRPEHDTVTRFPYCLHPLQVWTITERTRSFSQIVGPLSPKHHLRAQSALVELEADLAERLMHLTREEITAIMLPATEFGRGLIARKVSKLAPKHSGGYTASFGEHAVWYVYSLSLVDQRGRTLAHKIGYSHSPESRLDAYNFGVASEVTGLQWKLETSQPTASEDAARAVEQSLLAKFHSRKLASNGEVIRAGSPNEIAVEIAVLMRKMASSGPAKV